MSVHDPEPKIPNDDNGKGLRIIGWILLIWSGVSMIVIPPFLWNTDWMPVVNVTCFLVGLGFVITGFVVARKARPEIELDEITHDMMAATHSGHQNDDPAVGDGPGTYPTERPA